MKAKFKAETGQSAFLEIESDLLMLSLDGSEFEGMAGIEIRDSLKHDFNKYAGWGVFSNKLPEEYKQDNENIIIPSPDYVEWLEEIAEKYCLHISSVSKITRGINWYWVLPELAEKLKNYKDRNNNMVVEMFRSGVARKRISNTLHMDYRKINRVLIENNLLD